MLRPTSAALVVAAVAGAAFAGCGADAGRPSAGGDVVRPTATAVRPMAPAAPPGDRPTTTARPSARQADAAGGDRADAAVPPPPRSWDATCPTATKSPMGCRAVRGRVLSIQSYDPDGDGDLHVIAVGGDVTFPGITVFDVRTSLRPRKDPVKGEYVTGAGPVFRGSLKQRQIQVDAFRVWRPRR